MDANLRASLLVRLESSVTPGGEFKCNATKSCTTVSVPSSCCERAVRLASMGGRDLTGLDWPIMEETTRLSTCGGRTDNTVVDNFDSDASRPLKFSNSVHDDYVRTM